MWRERIVELMRGNFESLRGFTLLETMFTLVIFSLIFFVLFQFMNVSNSNWFDAEIGVQLREQAEHAIDRVFGELRAAIRFTTVILTNLKPGTVQSGFFIPADVLTRADGKTYALGFQLPEVQSKEQGGTGTVLDSKGEINSTKKIIYYLNTAGNLVRSEVNLVGVISGTTTVLGRSISFFEVVGDKSSAPNYVDVRLNFKNTSLSKRLIVYGQDPSSGTAWRGSGTRVLLRNAQTIDSPAKPNDTSYESNKTLDLGAL